MSHTCWHGGDSGRGVTANRVLAHMRKFFNWAVERDILATAPTTSVKTPVREASRDRVLTDQEVRWLWQACSKVGQPWGQMAQFLLLTGQRLNAVAQMTESEITGTIWRLAAHRVKNARAHDVPFSAAAVAVLASVQRIKGEVGYIFTTTGGFTGAGLRQGSCTALRRNGDGGGEGCRRAGGDSGLGFP